MKKTLLIFLLAILLVFGWGVWFFSRTHDQDAHALAAEHDEGDGQLVEYPAAFSGFVQRWNQETANWLARERTGMLQRIRLVEGASADAEGQRLELLKAKKTLIEGELEEFDRIIAAAPFIRELPADQLPDGLQWQNGQGEPDIGDPAALKGGYVNLWNPTGFPATLRQFGPNSKTYFNYSLYDNVEMRLVYIHPQTGNIIPGLAGEWAIGQDGRTVFYKIHPKARYSDGRPVRARDYLLNICLRTSQHAADPYYFGIFRRDYTSIRTYGSNVLALTVPRAKPFLPYVAGRDFYPASPAFYRDFDAAFVLKYQWKVPPTTGGYTVYPNDIVKGRSVTMRRVKTWWARDLKFYRHTCNVDSIIHNFIGDENRALELFRRGEIDAITIHKPEIWNEKMEIPPVFDGYIRRVNFLSEFPRPPFGLFVNMASIPVSNDDVRTGLQYAMNMGLALERVFQGDMRRSGSYASGYGTFTNGRIKPREYSQALARQYFARAGYIHQGEDGILSNVHGKRLEIELTYADMSPLMSSICRLLKQYARACGLEIRLDPLESSVCARKVFEKRHQVAFWAWPLPYPLPQLSKMFHSSLAYDDAGRLIPYTDNIVSAADLELDQYLMEERDAETPDQFREATYKVQQRLHDLAVWVPGWEEPWARVAFWRWVRWPDSDTTRFCYPAIYDPLESHLYWVDPQLKEETEKARSEGKTYPESEETIKPRVIDHNES